MSHTFPMGVRGNRDDLHMCRYKPILGRSMQFRRQGRLEHLIFQKIYGNAADVAYPVLIDEAPNVGLILVLLNDLFDFRSVTKLCVFTLEHAPQNLINQPFIGWFSTHD